MMLTHLYIENLLYIDILNIDFKKGFTAITGDTGSGKSLIINSIKYVFGEKISKNICGKKSDKVTICLDFLAPKNPDILTRLSDCGVDVSFEIISVKRIINNNKISKFFINDFPVSQTIVKELANYVIEFQGQHSQTLLLDNINHLNLLDNFSETNTLKAELYKKYNDYIELKKQLQLLKENIEKNNNEKLYLIHAIKELSDLNIKTQEEEELLSQKQFAKDIKKISDNLNYVITSLEQEDFSSHLVKSYRLLEELANINYENFSIGEEAAALDRIILEINDLHSALQDKATNLVSDINIEQINDRLFLLQDKARKYRCRISDLPNFILESEKKLAEFQSDESAKNSLESQIKDHKDLLYSIANKLSEKRKNKAADFAKKMIKEFKELKMDKATFEVSIDSNEEYISANGFDKVKFLFSSNPDIAPAEIGKVASGGELSRLMLAIRVIISNLKFPPTMIFDEIDTGIGGAIAEAVGEKLLQLSCNNQIIVVTHQPQVAAKSNNHILVNKEFVNDITKVKFTYLDNQAAKTELARMLSGKNVINEAITVAKKLKENY